MSRAFVTHKINRAKLSLICVYILIQVYLNIPSLIGLKKKKTGIYSLYSSYFMQSKKIIEYFMDCIAFWDHGEIIFFFM